MFHTKRFGVRHRNLTLGLVRFSFHPTCSLLQALTLAVKYYSRFHGRRDTKPSYLGRVFVTPSLLLVPITSMLDRYCTDARHDLQERLMGSSHCCGGNQAGQSNSQGPGGFLRDLSNKTLLTAQDITLRDRLEHCN